MQSVYININYWRKQTLNLQRDTREVRHIGTHSKEWTARGRGAYKRLCPREPTHPWRWIQVERRTGIPWRITHIYHIFWVRLYLVIYACFMIYISGLAMFETIHGWARGWLGWFAKSKIVIVNSLWEMLHVYQIRVFISLDKVNLIHNNVCVC